MKVGFSAIACMFFIFIALTAPWLAGESKSEDNIFPIVKFGPEAASLLTTDPLSPPSKTHWFGTDYVARDVFSRLVHGIRNSLFFSMAVVFVCTIVGMILGALMGFFGGFFDLIFSRIVEIIGNFPLFLLQLTLLAFLDQNYWVLLFVMTFSGWIPYARFTRAEVLRIRKLDYITAVEAMGACRLRILAKHIIPNSLSPTLIYIPFDLSSTIIALGALSFLGFGEPIHVASLGELLKQAKDHFQNAWWLAVYPGGALFLMTLCFTLFGASLRDRLDPRTQT